MSVWETSTPVCMQALGEGLVGVGAGGGYLRGRSREMVASHLLPYTCVHRDLVNACVVVPALAVLSLV